jgi:hypothetical protein
MPISTDSYRSAIGIWHLVSLTRKIKKTKLVPTPIKIKLLLGLILNSYGVFIGVLLILRCGDVHPNPGPPFENKSLKICHINVQSLYLRIGNHTRKIDEIESLLINDQHMDIICLSETWLDPQIDTTQVDIKDFEFIRKDRLAPRLGYGGVGMNITEIGRAHV